MREVGLRPGPAPSRRRSRLFSSPLLAASAVAHGAGAAALVASPESAPLIASILVANHAVIATAGMFPRSGWLGPNITRLEADATDTTIALTFDDGPDPAVTPQVLDLLDEAGQKATFFCIGRRAQEHPDLIADMRARGHGVENHTFHHRNGFALGGPGRMAVEVARAQDAIEASGGGRPTFFRAPAGIQNPWLHDVLADAGLRLVSWTRRGYDTVTHDASRVAARLIGHGLSAGDILLLHDGASLSARAEPRTVVLDALPRVLEEMARRGLTSESLHVAMGTTTRTQATGFSPPLV